nr:hypothetical protein [uncultured Dorea sp.]
MRYSYFVIKRTCILLVEMLIILLAYIGSLVNLPVLLLVIVGTAYSILRLGCMIVDKINRPVRKRLEYRRMTTGRIWNRWDSSKGKELKKFTSGKLIFGKISFRMEDKPYGYKQIYWTIDSLLQLINSRFFIEAGIRLEWLKGLSLREETGILKGFVKGNVLQELAEQGGMAEVTYYRYSGIIKDIKVIGRKSPVKEVEVWHEWNKRYEYVQLNHIRLGGAFNLFYEALKRISNGKKLRWNYNGSADFQEINFTQLDDKEIKEKILNAEEVYFLISRPEDKVVLEQGKKAKDQLIERKVWDGQLYTGIHFFGRDNVEIMGAKGIKTMKWLMKECRSRGYKVREV